MLFDLRGRGRRRTVQVIYVFLAILMGGGLVFFGIGGNTSGGLFDALGLTGKGNTAGSGADIFVKQEKAADKRIKANPRDSQAWLAATRARYQIAGQGQNFDQQTSTFTDSGRHELRKAAQAWDRYLALDKTPDGNVATLMVQAFGPAGLNQPAQAVVAAEVVSGARPSAQAFGQLALYAYQAKQVRKGDLAAGRAVDLAPAAGKSTLRSQLQQAKAQALAPKTAPSSGSTTPSLTPGG